MHLVKYLRFIAKPIKTLLIGIFKYLQAFINSYHLFAKGKELKKYFELINYYLSIDDAKIKKI